MPVEIDPPSPMPTPPLRRHPSPMPQLNNAHAVALIAPFPSVFD